MASYQLFRAAAVRRSRTRLPQTVAGTQRRPLNPLPRTVPRPGSSGAAEAPALYPGAHRPKPTALAAGASATPLRVHGSVDCSGGARAPSGTSGCSMLATILSVPPQRWPVSISMPNTRFNRFAQFIATHRGVDGWAASAGKCFAAPHAPPRRRHQGAQSAVRREHAAEAGQARARRRYQRRHALNDRERCNGKAA